MLGTWLKPERNADAEYYLPRERSADIHKLMFPWWCHVVRTAADNFAPFLRSEKIITSILIVNEANCYIAIYLLSNAFEPIFISSFSCAGKWQHISTPQCVLESTEHLDVSVINVPALYHVFLPVILAPFKHHFQAISIKELSKNDLMTVVT